MESLESQVTDLRYLTQNAITPLAESTGLTPQTAHGSPGSAVGTNSAHRRQQQHHQRQSLASSSGTGEHHDVTMMMGGETSGGKRKSVGDDEPLGKQQRSKRNRYISIACNECKRRKIKCNGETPCQRCGNLNLQCLYTPNCCSTSVKDSEEFRDMSNTVTRLQEQVETLFNNMNALRSETLRLAPIQDRMLPLPSATTADTPSSSGSIPSMHRPDLAQLRPPTFRGPTSHQFTLDVAKNTLQKMGYSSMEDTTEENDQAPEDTPNASPRLALQQQRPPQDPLWGYDKGEMIRLCRVHEEEVGIMYPVARIETTIEHATTLSSWMQAAKKNGLVPPFGQDGGMHDAKTLLLKIIMANAVVVEDHGNSERATLLFESVRPYADKMLMSESANFNDLPFLALVAGYRFLSNDEILAWRCMGQVARHCIELGLHRRETLMNIPDEETRKNAIMTFWSAYTLDRRWSFGTGLPFVIQDAEVDPQLPRPEAYPFLTAMVDFAKLTAKVWSLARHFQPSEGLEERPEEIEDLDQQIKRWYLELPRNTQLDLPDWELSPRYLNPPLTNQKEYDLQRLQIWTYLRLNQIRIWLYTPILHTHSSIMENMHIAERVIKLAKITVRYLTHINNSTNLYQKMQVFYHQFLTSAIAVLFLASCHAPVNFSAECRDEFYMALELVKDLSTKSYVSKRLWRTIKSLREVAPRLGLAETEDPHSSAALTMAGLATGVMRPGQAQTQSTAPPTPSMATFGRPPLAPATGAGAPTPGSSDTVVTGVQISSEMSRIFEGYMGMGNNGFSLGMLDDMSNSRVPTPGDTAESAPGMTTVDDAGPVFGSQGSGNGTGSVYQHFKELF